jgi:cell division protein FtsI/penicillin-binding protein 2
MKPLTVSAAIDLGLVTPETTYEDKGYAIYSGRKIENWDHKALGTLSIVGLLQKSNNIGAAWVGTLVGSKKLHNYFDAFGIGKKTNIELEGEEAGTLRNYQDWREIDTAAMSFGQGVAATPLQVLNAFNVFANGGYLLEPKIISKIVDGETEIEMPTKNLRKVISKETAESMVGMLEKAVEGGEAKYFTLKDYRVSGKTGTAEVPDETGYSAERTNATFVGFMTGTKKFSMIIRLEEPKTSVYAAETAVPLWMSLATELVKHFGLPPDKQIATSN